MKRYVFMIAAILGAVAARAQTDDLSKQLEVTRAYTPRVGQATKLAVTPDMTDTVRLRPEVSYRITSTASATSFSTEPFEAAVMSVAPFEIRRPLYVRLGVGAPFATVADIYFTPRTRTGSAFGIFANHSGSYSKITNDLGVKADATEMTGGAGLWGSRQWRRYSLEGDVTYDHRLYDLYGVAPLDPDPVSSVLPQSRNFVYDKGADRFKLGLARAGVSFGDGFTDLSRFNFRVGAGGGYAHGSDEARLDINLKAAEMFGDGGRHGFEAVLGGRGTFDAADHDGASSDRHAPNRNTATVSFMPRYLLSAGVWSLRAGFDLRYVSNERHGQDYLGFAPSMELRANLAGGAFVPFLGYTSRIVDGDHESLSRRNPYVAAMYGGEPISGTTAWVNDARIGFSGDLGDVFSYKFFGGMSLLRDYQLFVGDQIIATSTFDGTGKAYDYTPMRFTPTATDGARFTAGARIGVHNLGGFGAQLYGNWNKFDLDGTHAAGDLPKYDAGVEFSYRYKDIFSLRLGAELTGEREYLVRGIPPAYSMPTWPDYTVRTIEPAVDISFAADAKIAGDLWIFLEGKNLAGQKLYPYPHYPGLGSRVLGGIKVVF